MKIPETPANVGAYYGNEENGQWQPNGVIIDGGVGGGVVGSGDAGVHRPSVYPVHIPRGHVPAGYVMAGAYYPPPGAYPPVPAPAQDDFADYMWMENEEEFDKQVMQQLEEEALMEQCIEAMLEDEQRERNSRPQVANGHAHYPTTSNGTPSVSLEETVSRSTLNPLAAEFVPTRVRQPPPPPATEVKQEPQSTEAPPTTQTTVQKIQEEETVSQTEQKSGSTEAKAEVTDMTKTEEPVAPSKDPPEVSAADVQPIQEPKPLEKRQTKEIKKEPTKPQKAEVSVSAKKSVKVEVTSAPKVVKMEAKVKKPTVVKSETQVQPKKKEVKPVKSETRAEEVAVPVPEAPKPQSPQTEEPTTPVTSTPAPASSATPPNVPSATVTGPKPINYAAAAKANKPKKPITATSVPVEKTVQPVQKKVVEKKKVEKPPVQRKNSAK